jgi:hypothetical protein
MRTLKVLLPLAVLAAVAATLAGSTARADDGDLAILGNKLSIAMANAGQGHGKGHHGKGVKSVFECTASGAVNVQLDCDDPFPNNEPNITVDPTNPQHMIASSNDYGSCCDQWSTTFDGGSTWATGNISTEPGGPTGSDPVTSFDVKHHVALHASLNYFFNDDFTQTCNGDLVVSPSKDGGLNWDPPVVVDEGKGCDLDKEQLFNDKEWITTDNNKKSKFYGRTYVTWTQFESHNGEFVRSPILESHSDDGGKHWSKAQEIDGSNKQLCTFQTAGHDGQCDEGTGSTSTITSDGTVYVAFLNPQNEALWEPGEEFDDQYLVVKSKDGGEHWSKPTFVAALEDGSNDYPFNEDGRQTLSGYQVRVWSLGNIASSPDDGTLYITFSDNRNGIHDVANPVTNTDVFVTSSTDDGKTWSSASRVDSGAGDQWFPFVDVNPVTGKLGILYNDRGASNGTFYGATLAEGMPGSFARTVLNTAPSDPVHSVFFTPEDTPACSQCALFHGDYIGLAYGSDGHANATWTDMRQFVSNDPDLGTGFLQFIEFARH